MTALRSITIVVLICCVAGAQAYCSSCRHGSLNRATHTCRCYGSWSGTCCSTCSLRCYGSNQYVDQTTCSCKICNKQCEPGYKLSVSTSSCNCARCTNGCDLSAGYYWANECDCRKCTLQCSDPYFLDTKTCSCKYCDKKCGPGGQIAEKSCSCDCTASPQCVHGKMDSLCNCQCDGLWSTKDPAFPCGFCANSTANRAACKFKTQLDLNSCACDCSVLDNRKLIYPPGPNDTLSALTDCGGGTRDATTCGCNCGQQYYNFLEGVNCRCPWTNETAPCNYPNGAVWEQDNCWCTCPGTLDEPGTKCGPQCNGVAQKNCDCKNAANGEGIFYNSSMAIDCYADLGGASSLMAGGYLLTMSVVVALAGAMLSVLA